MSVKFLSKVFDDQSLKPTKKLLMLALADLASDSEGQIGTCYPSINTLMEKTGLSNKGVINNLELLVEDGYLLKAYRSRKNGGRSSNKYLLYPNQNLPHLDQENTKLFTGKKPKKPTSSFTQSEPETLPQSERGSQGCKSSQSERGSQGQWVQSERGSQECYPSLNTNHHLPSDEGGEKVVKKSKKKSSIPYQEIANAWNEVGLGEIRLLSESRKKAIRQRTKDLLEVRGDLKEVPVIESWTRLFAYIQRSDFLMGRSSEWSMTFDWLLKPSNFVKVIEGNYENREVA